MARGVRRAAARAAAALPSQPALVAVIPTVVDEFPAGPGAFAVVSAAGAMWVTSYAGSDVGRYDVG